MGNETLGIRQIIDNTKEIYMTDSSLNTLLDFERVLDSLDLYAYTNWQSGELISGPQVEKYFVTCKFMWPYTKMPDPRGGLRLLQYQCELQYQKTKLAFPAEIENPMDYEEGTKVAKTEHAPIWIVTITMPKVLMNEIERGSLEIEGESIDLEDLEAAYEQGTDDDLNKKDSDDETLATQDENMEGGEMEDENF